MTRLFSFILLLAAALSAVASDPRSENFNSDGDSASATRPKPNRAISTTQAGARSPCRTTGPSRASSRPTIPRHGGGALPAASMVPQDIPRRSPAPRPTHIPRLRRHIHERLRLRQRHICRHTPLWLRIVQHRHNRPAHRRRQHRGRARRQLEQPNCAGIRAGHLPQRVAPHRRDVSIPKDGTTSHLRRHHYNPHRRGKHLRQRPLLRLVTTVTGPDGTAVATATSEFIAPKNSCDTVCKKSDSAFT